MDKYADKVLDPDDPVRSAEVLTPHDTNDLATVPRALCIGVAGDVTCILADDTVSTLFTDISGIIPIMVKRVLATGTTATNIVALY